VIILVGLLSVLGSPAHAYDIPMLWISNGAIVPGSSQSAGASVDGVSMRVVTTGLNVDGAYTLWVAYFNHPEYCVDQRVPELRCGPADFANPLADLSVVYGDGLVSAGQTDTFEAFVPAGVAPQGEEQVAMGSGVLTNPTGAEYQAVVRWHGPYDARFPQTTTYNGGCHVGEPYECHDVQSSGFRSQFPFTLVP
jgi:hypothetical protein